MSYYIAKLSQLFHCSFIKQLFFYCVIAVTINSHLHTVCHSPIHLDSFSFNCITHSTIKLLVTVKFHSPVNTLIILLALHSVHALQITQHVTTTRTNMDQRNKRI